MGKRDELDTIWEVPDDLWTEVKWVLDEVDPDPKGRHGRPRIDPRRALNGVIFRMRTSCQWNHLPREFGDASSVHRTFQRWVNKGVFERVWALLIERCDGLGAVQWEWQAVDGVMGKARSGGTSPRPAGADRGKAGTKRSVLVDGGGGPLSVVVAGANVNDFKLLRSTIEAMVVERPEDTVQNLCLDKGYDNAHGYLVSLEHGYEPHIRQIGEEKFDGHGEKTFPARRWVVERTIGWLSKCHALLVRLDKKARNYLGLVHLDFMLIWYRRCHRLGLLR